MPPAVRARLASAALQPDNAHAHLLLSRIFRGQRKLSCALHHVLELLRVNGDSVDALAAYAFLLQHDSEQTSPACIQPKTSAASISDVQQRLCKALHTAAAAHTVLLPPSMCFLAPPTLLVTDASYTSQWSSFFRTHMPAQMRSNNFVPGCYPGFMAAPVAFCASLWLDALDKMCWISSIL